MRNTLTPFVPDKSGLMASFAHVKSCESEDGRDNVEEFWQAAVAGRSEGLMIKVWGLIIEATLHQAEQSCCSFLIVGKSKK